ncbi:hypothetical protein E2320_012334 [Naja naja]|nr:hypothetical protein E2320_012334 [Naja naja]
MGAIKDKGAHSSLLPLVAFYPWRHLLKPRQKAESALGLLEQQVPYLKCSQLQHIDCSPNKYFFGRQLVSACNRNGVLHTVCILVGVFRRRSNWFQSPDGKHWAVYGGSLDLVISPLLSGVSQAYSQWLFTAPTSGNTPCFQSVNPWHLWATPAQEWLERSQGHAKEWILKASPVAQEPSLGKPGSREAQRP